MGGAGCDNDSRDQKITGTARAGGTTLEAHSDLVMVRPPAGPWQWNPQREILQKMPYIEQPSLYLNILIEGNTARAENEILRSSEVHVCTCDEHDGRLPHAGIYFLPVNHVRVEPANPEPVDGRERPLMPDVETVVQGTCCCQNSGNKHGARRHRPSCGKPTEACLKLSAWRVGCGRTPATKAAKEHAYSGINGGDENAQNKMAMSKHFEPTRCFSFALLCNMLSLGICRELLPLSTSIKQS